MPTSPRVPPVLDGYVDAQLIKRRELEVRNNSAVVETCPDGPPALVLAIITELPESCALTRDSTHT